MKSQVSSRSELNADLAVSFGRKKWKRNGAKSYSFLESWRELGCRQLPWKVIPQNRTGCPNPSLNLIPNVYLYYYNASFPFMRNIEKLIHSKRIGWVGTERRYKLYFPHARSDVYILRWLTESSITSPQVANMKTLHARVEPVWRNGRAYDSGPRGRRLETR